jgi:endonuclease/exonuclease/phosphatase family metal-dependent hydrolase
MFLSLILVTSVGVQGHCAGALPERFVVAWWNLENLFDTVNDPDPLPQFGTDDEFLPEGARQWTDDRYWKKLENLARAIRSMNNGSGPDVMGVCEVEHEHILNDLIRKYLPDLGYATAYHESPDARGIDIGFLYRRDLLKVQSTGFRTVVLPPDEPPTRDVFYVAFETGWGPLVCIGNHWPSRRGGAAESEFRRVSAARTCRSLVDSVLSTSPEADIVIVGDFNDEPWDASVASTLRAVNNRDSVTTTGSTLLYQCMSHTGTDEGTYNFHGTWNMLDQCILSRGLLDSAGFSYDSVEIYKPTFLIEQGGRYAGYPFPTYGGQKYLGGYSDHFPLLLFLHGYEPSR